MNSKYKLVKTVTDLSTVKIYYCVSYFQSYDMGYPEHIMLIKELGHTC